MRLEVRPRPLLRGRHRPRQAGGPPPDQPAEPAPPVGCGGEVDVGHDLGDGEGKLLGAEARVEGRDDPVDAVPGQARLVEEEVAHRRPLELLECRAQLGEGAPERSVGQAGVVEQLGTALECGRGGGLDRADIGMHGAAIRVRR